jgi:hypothetical protein
MQFPPRSLHSRFLIVAPARLPSSPEWSACALGFLLAHDLFRKPVPTFRDHALMRAGFLPGVPAP